MIRSAEDPDVAHALAVLDGSCRGDRKAARRVVASVVVGARPRPPRPLDPGHERVYAVLHAERFGIT